MMKIKRIFYIYFISALSYIAEDNNQTYFMSVQIWHKIIRRIIIISNYSTHRAFALKNY
jgi:hypothetical protein